MLLLIIKDYFLWEDGFKKINWVKRFMFILNQIRKEYEDRKLFKGFNVVIFVYFEVKMVNFVLFLKDLGSNVFVIGFNFLFI